MSLALRDGLREEEAVGSAIEDLTVVMTTYVLVVNDVPHVTGVTTASEIIDFLLARRVWVFPKTAPHVKRLEVGDRLIIYVAGRKAGFFLSEMRVASEPQPVDETLRKQLQRLGLTWFSQSIKVSAVTKFEPPRPVRPLLSKLKFVSDKQNYGLYFRQGVRRLEEADARVIVGK